MVLGKVFDRYGHIQPTAFWPWSRKWFRLLSRQ